ncbi:uncharacterized protein LOC125847267 [Solanum stenotomum]|uniref:uncharacterized protein LOC125847267 n=1 Tax=Solanum stenotomum TaxID=172797 RepID=UPI0020CFE959|nr:uncharacterized protein LOC125847267 [Solanum stenotomum]
MFIKRSSSGNLIIQIYVDDIIFGSANNSLCKEFSELMQSEFEMSMMGELTFFLELQIYQSEKGIFLCQTKYYQKFGMENSKPLGTPMSSTCSLDKDEKGDKDDRKSTSDSCQILGKSLISWNNKKQGSVSLSTTEAEYIAISQ